MKLHKKLAIPMMMTMALAISGVYAQDSRSAAQIKTDAAGTSLTDGQILQVVRTLNDGEIKQAEEALDESDSDAVKQVAQMIVRDHEESNDKLDELLKGDLDLDDSPLSDMLGAQAEATHEELDDLSDARYDCAYLQQQVAQHETAMNTVKTQLLPHAKNSDVSQFLTAMAPKLEGHRDMAKEALGKTAGCG